MLTNKTLIENYKIQLTADLVSAGYAGEDGKPTIYITSDLNPTKSIDTIIIGRVNNEIGESINASGTLRLITQSLDINFIQSSRLANENVISIITVSGGKVSNLNSYLEYSVSPSDDITTGGTSGNITKTVTLSFNYYG